jgi:hypothetical protein
MGLNRRDINPFQLMVNPMAVMQAIESSEDLAQLERRVCRPLDKPILPKQFMDEINNFGEEVLITGNNR